MGTVCQLVALLLWSKQHKQTGRQGRCFYRTDSESKEGTRLVTLDVTKDYPEKKIVLQDLADVKYIPLETKKNALLPNSAGCLGYVSDSLIVARTSDNEIVLFNGDGSVRSSFRHVGQGSKEYQYIIGMAVDPKAQEIFIVDYLLKYRMQVYSFTGQYKRTLPIPYKMILNSLQDFSADCLLACDMDVNQGISNRAKPYMLLSKKTGEIVKELDIHFTKRMSNRMSKPFGENQTISAALGYDPIVRCEDSYVIGDLSADTIYTYTPQGVLSPMLVRTPPVLSMELPKCCCQTTGQVHTSSSTWWILNSILRRVQGFLTNIWFMTMPPEKRMYANSSIGIARNRKFSWVTEE